MTMPTQPHLVRRQEAQQGPRPRCDPALERNASPVQARPVSESAKHGRGARGKAARSIRKRLQELVGPDGLTAANLARFTTDELRPGGLSSQKASYVADLASKVNDGTVNLRQIGRFSDERVVETLTQVRGIGQWTAQMFLIFSLGRPDVFPQDDLGVRTAIRDRYGLDDLPDRKTSRAIASAWQPYASVASWYCWQTLDLARNTQAVAKG